MSTSIEPKIPTKPYGEKCASCGLRINPSQFDVDGGGVLNTQSIPVYVIEVNNTDQTIRCINNMTYKEAYYAIMTTGLIVCTTTQNRQWPNKTYAYGIQPILSDSTPYITDTNLDIVLMNIEGNEVQLRADDTLFIKSS